MRRMDGEWSPFLKGVSHWQKCLCFCSELFATHSAAGTVGWGEGPKETSECQELETRNFFSSPSFYFYLKF